jgi:hypothetical protein
MTTRLNEAELPLPLSERLVRALPGSSTTKILLWASLGPIRPLIAFGVLLLIGEGALATFVLDRNLVIQWLFGYIVIVALTSTRSLRRDLEGILRAIPSEERNAARRHAEPIGWSIPPLVIAVALTTIAAAGREAAYPLPMVASDALILLLILIPVGAWVWTYAVALWRLDEIGRALVDESPFPGDKTLGTRPLGELAFRGFVAFSAAVVPFLVILATSAFDVAQGLGLFLLGVAVFVVALWRVRRRLVTAKARHVARARQLYDAAVKPLRNAPSAELLNENAATITAADALLARANALAEWPIDEAVPARLLAIVFAVVTTVISAFVLRTIGFG